MTQVPTLLKSSSDPPHVVLPITRVLRPVACRPLSDVGPAAPLASLLPALLSQALLLLDELLFLTVPPLGPQGPLGLRAPAQGQPSAPVALRSPPYGYLLHSSARDSESPFM